MTGNLFAAIRRALPADLDRTFLERPDGSSAQLRRSARPVRPRRAGLAGARRPAGGSGRGPGRKERGSADALSGRDARRCGLPATEHCLHCRRGPLLPGRRRAHAVRLPTRGRGADDRTRRRGRHRSGRDAGGAARGDLVAAGAGRCSGGCGRAVRRGRLGGHPLHLGHHRPFQGCDAEPRQPRLQRADPARRLAVHGRRPAAARPADLPHPWPVRRHQRHAPCRWRNDLSAWPNVR